LRSTLFSDVFLLSTFVVLRDCLTKNLWGVVH
jgi:hypothetical protein